MLHQVKLFFDYGISNPMKYWVGAMEDGLVHIDAVNQRMETLGVVCAHNTRTDWQREFWLRYWALKPSPEKFWTSLTNSYNLNSVYLNTIMLSRIADIPALWEDLSFLYNLVAENGYCLAWLLPELDRRVCASLRLAWIAAVAR
jgi:hypothetical protein